MLKLTKIYNLIKEEKAKYDMTFINGGFSGNIDLNYDPQTSPDTIAMKIAIYGGGKPSQTTFQVPQQFASDPTFQENVKAEMSAVMVSLLKKLDKDAYTYAKQIVEKNIKSGGTSTETEQPTQ